MYFVETTITTQLCQPGFHDVDQGRINLSDPPHSGIKGSCHRSWINQIFITCIKIACNLFSKSVLLGSQGPRKYNPVPAFSSHYCSLGLWGIFLLIQRAICASKRNLSVIDNQAMKRTYFVLSDIQSNSSSFSMEVTIASPWKCAMPYKLYLCRHIHKCTAQTVSPYECKYMGYTIRYFTF